MTVPTHTIRVWLARRPLLAILPERRLASAVAVLSILWLLPGRVGPEVAAAGLALVVGLSLADLIRLPGRSDLRVERELPAEVGIGELVSASYLITSRWGRRVRARIIDEIPTELHAGDEPLGEVEVGAGEARRVPFRIRGAARGKFVLGRVALRVHTPLGFMAVHRVYKLADSVLVTPSVASVRRFRLLALQHRLNSAGVRVLRIRGDGRGFAGLREYVRGDDPRHIDWKATARQQKLITREYTIERSQTLVLIIDSGRSMTQLAGPYARFEYALSAALVLTDVAAAAGDRVGVLVFDAEVRAFVAPRPGRPALRAIRNALVPVAATMTEPDYAAAFQFLAMRQRKRALLVFFTDVIDPRASRALLAQLSRSRARHLVAVVALRNDALYAATVPKADRELALYQGAVAEELVLEREEALARMRREGVAVLDVSPETMTAAVVNRYLEIKARGAL